MENIATIAQSLDICRIMAYALPRFYNRTKKNVYFNFGLSEDKSEMVVNIGFPKEEQLKEDLYKILFEEISEAETLVRNDNLFNKAQDGNINYILNKSKEETQTLIDKHKNNVS